MHSSQESAPEKRVIDLIKEGLRAEGAKEIPDGVVEGIREGVKVDLFLSILVPRKYKEEIAKQ